MSAGFDENPFGEPTEPFADPAIQQVTSNTSSVQRGLEDYNPFADQGDQRFPAQVRGAANPPPYLNASATQPAAQPAIMQPTHEAPPPPYTRSGQQTQQQQPQITTAEFQRRQEELERKAQELARREEELKNAPYNARRNNWPPLPEKCCFQPCFYQDINVDIPLEFQKIVRYLYYLWMFHACIMLLNVFGGLLLMFSVADFTTFGLGLLYLILFTPFSFLCWYRPAYKAFRSDSSFNFMVFFFVFFFQFIVTVIQAIGIHGSGTCGILLAVQQFSTGGAGVAVGVILLIVAIGFVGAACVDLLLLSKIHRIYRSTGASFAKAQQEFTSEFLRNEHVQNAATSAAAATVRAQMNNSNSSRY
ncbi:secretory carrier-associated membrane protein 1 isoform X1 [Schistocerca cancellata]|uniref:secretory carrier-associated membrane protein 1 isoform X1 n=1 Tax=Schistocerca cancellata TaxID=274614 RepID=UPI00211753D6|nr:secretory carrier-associated membrane protein 1 isoform X1 [Schistocerca cancellata]